MAVRRLIAAEHRVSSHYLISCSIVQILIVINQLTFLDEMKVQLSLVHFLQLCACMVASVITYKLQICYFNY